MGEPRDIKDVAAAAGAPPAVFREIERLRRTTDGERHFTLLFYPQFLFNDDGEPLFAGERAKAAAAAGLAAWAITCRRRASSAISATSSTSKCGCWRRSTRSRISLRQELRDRLDKIPRLAGRLFRDAQSAAVLEKAGVSLSGHDARAAQPDADRRRERDRRW